MNKPLTERYAAFPNTILASIDNWNPPEYSKSKQSSSVSICWYCGWSTASLTDTLLITGNWVPRHKSRICKKNKYRVSVLQKSTPPNKRYTCLCSCHEGINGVQKYSSASLLMWRYGRALSYLTLSNIFPVFGDSNRNYIHDGINNRIM